MTEAFIPSRADRWKAMGVLALGLGMLTAVLYGPLLKPWWQTESQLRALRAKIVQAQQLQQMAPRIDAELSELRGRLQESGDYLPEPNIALANAGLAQRIQQVTTDAASTDSICVLGNRVPITKEGEDSACPEARFNLDMQCGTAALQRTLRALETQPPRLRVVRMTITPAPNPLGFDKPVTGDAPLNVSLEIAGCLMPDAFAVGDAPGHG